MGVSWQISWPGHEVEDTSGDICAVITQHWTWCEILPSDRQAGLTMQQGQLLGTPHQLCLLRRGTRACSVRHVLRMGLLPPTCAVADECYC